MPEYTDDDVTRLAKMLGAPHSEWGRVTARILLEQGVTLPPPPDPAVVVAEALDAAIRTQGVILNSGPRAAVLRTVRDLFTTDALKAAAAKVQEASDG